MKKLVTVLLIVVLFSSGCASTLQKGCKELTELSVAINDYIPNAEQLVAEGKLSESVFNDILGYVDYIEKAKASACALKIILDEQE
jgi:thioredoxin-related protein